MWLKAILLALLCNSAAANVHQQLFAKPLTWPFCKTSKVQDRGETLAWLDRDTQERVSRRVRDQETFRDVQLRYVDLYQAEWDEGLPQVDIVCLTKHCFSEMRKCFTNSDCRQAVFCVAPCGSDMDCVMKCMINYANAELTEFMTCASQEHACLVLPPQVPPFNCTLPKQTDITFSYKTMPGDWYVVLGGNPTYDCFPCQKTTFHPISANGSIDALMKYQAIDNEGEIKKLEQESHIVPDANRNDLLHLTSNDFGNILEDDWLVIQHAPAKYMLIYYCGRLPTGGEDYWYYEGGVVYSKTKSLGAADKEKINEAATNADINLNNWCPVDHSQCS